MITIDDISQGKYKQYQGPYFRGTKKYILPTNPSEADKTLQVITATEGGRYDAVNAYDRCIISVGLIQWCEAAYFLTSKMLAKMPDDLVRDKLSTSLDNSAAGWNGKRFHWTTGEEIDNKIDQQRLFLWDSTGHQGTWNAASWRHAKQWTADMANLLTDPVAMKVQVDYTAARLKGFATRPAKQLLWSDAPETDVVHMVRAGFLSFAANLPAVAGKHLIIAAENSIQERYSLPWAIDVFEELTFGSGITIYPHRWDKISPWLQRLYGMELPPTATELRKGYTAAPFSTVKEIQVELLLQGYVEVGVADDKPGRKFSAAVKQFQQVRGIKADGQVGPTTREHLKQSQAERLQASADVLGAELRQQVDFLLATGLDDMIANYRINEHQDVELV